MGRMRRNTRSMPSLDAMITGDGSPGARSARNFRAIPLLGKLEKSGLNREKEWVQEEFEDMVFGDFLEHSNRSSPGQTCIEKKGAEVDSVKCDFACFLDCQLKTIEWRNKELEAEFKEAHFSKEEGMQLFALFHSAADKIRLIQRSPGAPGNRHIQRAAEKAIQQAAQAAVDAKRGPDGPA